MKKARESKTEKRLEKKMIDPLSGDCFSSYAMDVDSCICNGHFVFISKKINDVFGYEPKSTT